MFAHFIISVAVAVIIIYQVQADPAVQTRFLQHTVIHVYLALATHKPIHTRAVEGIEQVLQL